MRKLQFLLKKVTPPLFPSNSPLKVEVLSSSPFLKIWLEANPPPPAERGVPTMLGCIQFFEAGDLDTLWAAPVEYKNKAPESFHYLDSFQPQNSLLCSFKLLLLYFFSFFQWQQVCMPNSAIVFPVNDIASAEFCRFMEDSHSW